MQVNDAYKLFALCLDVMPTRFPKPRLVVHESGESLVGFMGDAPHAFLRANEFPASLLLGMADAKRNTVHLPFSTIATEDRDVVLDTLLHELGHLYQATVHGEDSPRYLDESLANAFARRWMKRIKAGRYLAKPALPNKKRRRRS